MRKDLFEYGYKWLGMEEITYENALKISNEKAVYLLYEDNTESLAENNDEITKHYNNGGRLGIELENYDNYVVFVLGRDLLRNILPFENDIAYEWCINIAKDFEISEYNINTRGLLDCLEKYINANIYVNQNEVYTFQNYDLYEVCGGVRGA